MAADDPLEILRVPGRLAHGCTDLALAWPHGGTGLGKTKMIVMQQRGTPYAVTMEAFGGEPVEYLEPGIIIGLACRIRTANDDALSLIFPNAAAGTTTQHQVVSDPGAVRAGNWMSGRGVVLVFTPEGSIHAKSATVPDVEAPFVVLYNAIPLLREDVDVPLSRGEEWAIDVVFQGIRDSSARIRKMGRRADLSLA